MKDIKELPLPIDIICGNDEQLDRVVKVLENNNITLSIDFRKYEYRCLIVRLIGDDKYSIAGYDVLNPELPASQFLDEYGQI